MATVGSQFPGWGKCNTWLREPIRITHFPMKIQEITAMLMITALFMHVLFAWKLVCLHPPRRFDIHCFGPSEPRAFSLYSGIFSSFEPNILGPFLLIYRSIFRCTLVECPNLLGSEGETRRPPSSAQALPAIIKLDILEWKKIRNAKKMITCAT